ncbi:MAG: hypothetical protein HC899_33985 [Leptolyngbyaceae cyanobacterium SM1_4_3]|nr:hypothetical protein [Leptolyngbyaceae cyanobacterium SM1_4_3]
MENAAKRSHLYPLSNDSHLGEETAIRPAQKAIDCPRTTLTHHYRRLLNTLFTCDRHCPRQRGSAGLVGRIAVIYPPMSLSSNTVI